jgi:site-specific DNA-methyltransferase (adenine-specific)
MSITQTIISKFRTTNSFSLREAYEVCGKDVQAHSVRARIYEGVGSVFEKIERGIYKVSDELSTLNTILVEGDGRDTSFLEDASVDVILTDHPYDLQSLKGGNRNFAEYDKFRYTLADCQEKFRLLNAGTDKPGVAVEFFPSETADNFEYRFEFIQNMQKAGFEYYATGKWKKGNFVANTGRTQKNTEDILFFVTKGKAAPQFKRDAKKCKANDVEDGYFMKGLRGMIPAAFDVQPPSKSERIHQAEKPVELIEQILDLVSFETTDTTTDMVLDNFAGSFSTAVACDNKHRSSISIEKDKTTFKQGVERLKALGKNFLVICEEVVSVVKSSEVFELKQPKVEPSAVAVDTKPLKESESGQFSFDFTFAF